VIIMALSIKDPELDRNVRRLARERNTTLTGAIKLAVDNELKKTVPRFTPEERAERLGRLTAITARIERSTLNFSQTDDEIMGYDDHGLPR
jgi:antitoxin VapB